MSMIRSRWFQSALATVVLVCSGLIVARTNATLRQALDTSERWRDVAAQWEAVATENLSTAKAGVEELKLCTATLAQMNQRAPILSIGTVDKPVRTKSGGIEASVGGLQLAGTMTGMATGTCQDGHRRSWTCDLDEFFAGTNTACAGPGCPPGPNTVSTTEPSFVITPEEMIRLGIPSATTTPTTPTKAR